MGILIKFEIRSSQGLHKSANYSGFNRTDILKSKFSHVVESRVVGLRKPDPKIYRLVVCTIEMNILTMALGLTFCLNDSFGLFNL